MDSHQKVGKNERGKKKLANNNVRNFVGKIAAGGRGKKVKGSE